VNRKGILLSVLVSAYFLVNQVRNRHGRSKKQGPQMYPAGGKNRKVKKKRCGMASEGGKNELP